MRIFIEPSGYSFTNAGDAAMLAVALERLRAQWPDAEITVHTTDADALRAVDAAAIPLHPSASRAWSRARRSRMLAALALRVKLWSAAAKPPLSDRKESGGFAAAVQTIDAFVKAVKQADLFLLSGAGSLNDAFKQNAHVVLDMIGLALGGGARVALAGQGIGPMTDRALRKHAAAVLPRVDFIALREEVASLPLLEDLGVARERISVTGDDAIIVAHRARAASLGDSLGVNLRVAPYSGVGDDIIERVGAIVRERGVPLVPIAIDAGDFVTALRIAGTTDHPIDVLTAIRQCRVVVAGSYHAAVFALSMGIPAVTIALSDYYIDKFRGLAAQFGDGCRVILASHHDFDSHLRNAVDDAWSTADATHAALLDAAQKQIALGEAAYRRIFALVSDEQRLQPRVKAQGE
jgi:colanic acid/amylovoran biosynthesis protein